MWDNLCNLNLCFRYMDSAKKDYLAAKDFKGFIEKYCYNEREFDLTIDIEDAELLVSRYDKIGNKYIYPCNIIE